MDDYTLLVPLFGQGGNYKIKSQIFLKCFSLSEICSWRISGQLFKIPPSILTKNLREITKFIWFAAVFPHWSIVCSISISALSRMDSMILLHKTFATWMGYCGSNKLQKTMRHVPLLLKQVRLCKTRFVFFLFVCNGSESWSVLRQHGWRGWEDACCGSPRRENHPERGTCQGV